MKYGKSGTAINFKIALKLYESEISYEINLHLKTRYLSPRFSSFIVTCTLYAVPCTLYPVPCTLYPVRCTLYPVPCTLYPVPCTLYPVPCTLYPVPCTLYAIPYTLLLGVIPQIQFHRVWIEVILFC